MKKRVHVIARGRCALASDPGADVKWWKGVTHVHSTWSDGTSYPEMVADWYKSHGYNFIVVTDHNSIQEGDKWKLMKKDDHKAVLEDYRKAFGDGWVQVRGEGAKQEVRCKPLSDYRGKVEEEGRFIILRGEEITCKEGKRQVHVTAANVEKLIDPKTTGDVRKTIEKSMGAVYAQAKDRKKIMPATLCHPNWGSGPTVEEVWPLECVKLFEVVNGIPCDAWNVGTSNMLSTDRYWDVLLSRRIEANLPIVYGVAADDVHRLQSEGGNSWIMVRAAELKPDRIVAAMEKGEFYASTGVRFKAYGVQDGKFNVEVEPEDGVKYTIRFIGTIKGYDKTVQQAKDVAGNYVPLPERYSQEIGKTLAEFNGTTGSYSFAGNEIYVRAKVLSSKMVTGKKGEKVERCAWTQPVIPGAK